MPDFFRFFQFEQKEKEKPPYENKPNYLMKEKGKKGKSVTD